MEEKVKKIISDTFFIDIDTIKLDSKLKEDLDIDSLDATSLVLDLEENYNIKVENSELVKLETVKDIIDLLKEKGVEIEE